MYQKIISFAVFWLSAIQINYSQNVILQGIVKDKETQKSIMGSLVYIDDSHATLTDSAGNFIIDVANIAPTQILLKTSFVGYKTDSLFVTNSSEFLTIQLEKDENIDAVVVEGKQAATSINALSGQQIELLSGKELAKAACCNLSESFENSATVDLSFNDAVTGSKQISMLGLAGIYTQVNWENMPLVRGLDQFHGLTSVPGPWIESIQVGKGAGSVVNGYESMTGQINVELHKPNTMDKFYLNGYKNLQGRSELNAHAGKQFNEVWSTGLFLHGNLLTGEVDKNDDTFMDRPKGGQINLMNRWKYISKGNIRGQFGAKFIHDEKVSGQVGFNKGDISTIGGVYGVDTENDRLEMFSKNGIIFPEKPWKSVGIITNATTHKHIAGYGINTLDNEQKSFYGNLIYQTMIGDTRKTLKTGANFQYDHFKEAFNTNYTKREYSIPGVFTELTYDNLSNIKIVAGIRADYLNTNEKVEVSPRVHIKWNTDGDNTVRLSAGRGFRAPNLYADAPAMLVSSRQLIIEETPKIESSWNMGASITRYFKLNEREGSIVTDFYRTTFNNQLIRDFFTSKNHVYITNLDGKSYANSLQTTIDYEMFNRFDVRLAYKHDDVKQEINGKRVERQLTPKHRGLLNLGYATNYERWKFDLTTQYTGKQRLPTTLNTPNGLQNAYFSDDFIKLNAQITTKYRAWEIYAGGENLTNYQQKHPIISAENPFGENFDASSVWGPIQGTNIYTGFRFKIEK